MIVIRLKLPLGFYRKQATGQGKVVQKHYIWRAGSWARNIEPLMTVSLVTETF